MTYERYRQLKQNLEGRRQRLRRSLILRLGEVRTHSDQNPRAIDAVDVGDAAVSQLEQEFDIALAELAAQELRQVDRALERLEGGDYGFCLDCGEPISGKRLQALPFAVRCRECEERQEGGEHSRRLAPRNHDFAPAYD